MEDEVKYLLADINDFQPTGIDEFIGADSLRGIVQYVTKQDTNVYLWPTELSIEEACKSLPRLSRKITHERYACVDEVRIIMTRFPFTTRTNTMMLFFREDYTIIGIYEHNGVLFGIEIEKQDVIDMNNFLADHLHDVGGDYRRFMYVVRGTMLDRPREEAVAYTTIINQQLYQVNVQDLSVLQAQYQNGPILDLHTELMFMNASDRDPGVGHA